MRMKDGEQAGEISAKDENHGQIEADGRRKDGELTRPSKYTAVEHMR